MTPITPIAPMPMHSPENERIKRRYFTYLKEANRRGEASVDAAAKALNRYEVFTKFRDFKAFHWEHAVAFKHHLAEQSNVQTGESLSRATLFSTLRALKAFFLWLAGQSGYRSRFAYSDSDYFNPSERDARIAKAPREKRVPSLEQIRAALAGMPSGNAIEQRDRAVMAFILLTGARDGAVASLKIKHVDLENRRVIQDAREVATKFGKTFDSYFMPVGDDIRLIVDEWVALLTVDLLWGPDDPLFPASLTKVGPDGQFHAVGLDRKHWRTADPIRKIFRRSFEAAGLPYFSPHRLRDTLIAFGQKYCHSAETFKAMSQNFGHSKVLTTLTSYGPVEASRQAEIIRTLGRAARPEDDALIKLFDAVDTLRQRPTST